MIFSWFLPKTDRSLSDHHAANMTWKRQTLMTPAEASFYHALRRVTGTRYDVFAKVRLADLFCVKQGKGRQAAFNKISRKHVDFILCDPMTTAVLAAIELDDSSHARPERITRDQFVNQVFAWNHLALLRIPVMRAYDPGRLRATLETAGLFPDERAAAR